MAFNRKQKLRDNIEAIRTAFILVRDRRDHAVEFLSLEAAHVFGLVAVLHIALHRHGQHLALGGLHRCFGRELRIFFLHRAVVHTRANVGKDTVDGKVRIAPDGRGEVGVICQRKAEVALGLRLVLCLGHAAQHTCVHRALQIGAPGIGQQLRKLQRGGRIARKMEVHTRRRQRLLQLFDPLWVRRFVHTVHERQLQPPRQRRRRGIGQ